MPSPSKPVLTDNLRKSDAWIPQLSLVAAADDAVIGHVCCTRAHLLPRERPVLGLGPIGVDPGEFRYVEPFRDL